MFFFLGGGGGFTVAYAYDRGTWSHNSQLKQLGDKFYSDRASFDWSRSG